jgi:hypothetical protein
MYKVCRSWVHLFPSASVSPNIKWRASNPFPDRFWYETKLRCVKGFAQLVTSNYSLTKIPVIFLFLPRQERVWLRPLTCGLHPVLKHVGGTFPSVSGRVSDSAPGTRTPLSSSLNRFGALLNGSLEGRVPHLYSGSSFEASQDLSFRETGIQRWP